MHIYIYIYTDIQLYICTMLYTSNAICKQLKKGTAREEEGGHQRLQATSHLYLSLSIYIYIYRERER